MFRRVSLYAISLHVAGTINMIWAASCSAQPGGQCTSKRITLDVARSTCEDADMRLCTLEELRARDCKGQTCGSNLDRARVWTSTTCGKAKFGSTLVSRASGWKRSGLCTMPDNRKKLRCCADDDRRLSPLSMDMGRVNLSTHTIAANEAEDDEEEDEEEQDEEDEEEDVSDRRLEFASPILV